MVWMNIELWLEYVINKISNIEWLEYGLKKWIRDPQYSKFII